jgi:hypothetical protein
LHFGNGSVEVNTLWHIIDANGFLSFSSRPERSHVILSVRPGKLIVYYYYRLKKSGRRRHNTLSGDMDQLRDAAHNTDWSEWLHSFEPCNSELLPRVPSGASRISAVVLLRSGLARPKCSRLLGSGLLCIYWTVWDVTASISDEIRPQLLVLLCSRSRMFLVL